MGAGMWRWSGSGQESLDSVEQPGQGTCFWERKVRKEYGELPPK
jgi:hypothetical protein